MNVGFIWQTTFASDNEPRWKKHISKTQHTHAPKQHANRSQHFLVVTPTDLNWSYRQDALRRRRRPAYPQSWRTVAARRIPKRMWYRIWSIIQAASSVSSYSLKKLQPTHHLHTTFSILFRYIFPGYCGLQLTNLHIRTPCRLWSARRSLPRALVTQTRNT